MAIQNRVVSLLLALGWLGCGGDDSATPRTSGSSTTSVTTTAACTADADCASTPDSPLCDVASGACAALPPGHPIGWRDGAATSVDLVVVLDQGQAREPTDVEFHPDRPSEMWVVNRKDDSVIIVHDPGLPTGSWERKHDPDAQHFMHRPPAFAFGAADTFGTCGDGDGGDHFMGPALFPADLAVFAKATPNGLGSHIDMLHSTSFCRGIAHQEANVYWAFNAELGSLDKYDFHQDHGPGNDDHSDGEIWRYALGLVTGVDGLSSHVSYRAEDRMLYVADTGASRVARLDTASGTPGATFAGDEGIATRRYVDGAVLVDVVPPGTLQQPSGIELHDELVYVSDAATSRFSAFDLAGQLVRTLDTGLPPGSLSGFTFGPDGKVYFVDHLSGLVYRIDPK